MPPRGTFSSATSEILVALQQAKVTTPTEAREGGLIVQAPRITVHEVNTVRTALMHPREKADTAAFAVSFASACVLVLKTGADILGAAAPSPFNLSLFAVGVALAAATVSRFVGQWRRKYPFHDLALGYVDALIAEKAADDAQRPASPQLPRAQETSSQQQAAP